jgi:hypothetical protein
MSTSRNTLSSSQLSWTHERTVETVGKLRFAVALLLTGLVLVVASPAWGDRINGTSGDDVLRGTDRQDEIFAREGADLLYGRGAFDYMIAGAGRDRLYGGPQSDTLAGGPGTDVLNGGRGTDRLYGGPGADVLYGGPTESIDYFERAARGSDTLIYGRGIEQGFSNRENDVILLWEDGRRDYIHCGSGIDVVWYEGALEPGDEILKCERLVQTSREALRELASRAIAAAQPLSRNQPSHTILRSRSVS